jgi:NAD(P)-dependent dehydrogenase (short-subunit alcohol dehydrogenase family)
MTTEQVLTTERAFTVPQFESKHYDDFVGKMPSMSGKTVAITGCTSGTGLIAATALVKKGAHVLMLNRASSRSAAAMKSVQAAAAENGPLSSSLTVVSKFSGSVTAIDCDLQSFESVHAAASAVHKALQLLIT